MPALSHHRILLTGAAGALGQAWRDKLKSNCSVLRLSNRLDTGAARAGEEIMLADLADVAVAGEVSLWFRERTVFTNWG